MKFYYKHEGSLKVVELGDTEMTIAECIDFVKHELALSKEKTVLGMAYEKASDFTLKGNV